MALIKPQSILIIVLLYGFGSILGEECTTEQFEACSGPLDAATENTEILCSKNMSDLMNCFGNAKCQMTQEQLKLYEKTSKKIQESMKSCGEIVSFPSFPGSCSPDQEYICTEGENVTADCRTLEKVILCLEEALKDCRVPEVKTNLKKLKDDLSKKRTEDKCKAFQYSTTSPEIIGCDMTEFQKCRDMQITQELNNQTANEKECMKVSKGRKCAEDFLGSCSEVALLDTMRKAYNMTEINFEYCKTKGYKISDDKSDPDDNNVGAFQQPTMGLVVFCLVMLMKQLNFE